MIRDLETGIFQELCCISHILHCVAPYIEPVCFIIGILDAELDPCGAEIEHTVYLLLPAPIRPCFYGKAHNPVMRTFAKEFCLGKASCCCAKNCIIASLNEIAMMAEWQCSECSALQYQLQLWRIAVDVVVLLQPVPYYVIWVEVEH